MFLSGFIGIKDIIDILLVATMLYYLYRTMQKSGSINIFIGVLAFVIIWVVLYKILDMQLIGTILDKFIDIGLFILVILFQDQIKHFLIQLGSQKHLRFITKLWHKDEKPDNQKNIMPIVYACMSMAKSKTGALIVIQREQSLSEFADTGDMLSARLNTRLLENIFFKNSPLHDGAVIVARDQIVAAGCILPVSHSTDVPRYLGLRHRSALGITQETDAVAVVVSEETGNISYFSEGKMYLKLSTTELENKLSELNNNA